MSYQEAKDREPTPYKTLSEENQVLLVENSALKDEIQNLRACLEEAEELKRAISEGEKKNEEIVAAEHLARSIIEQAAGIIVVCDTSGRITRFSNALLDLCGCDPAFQKFEDIINLRFSEEECAGESILPIAYALKGFTILAVEATFECEDHQKFHLLLNAGPLKNADSEIIGCVINLADITGLRQAERALQQTYEEIKTQSEELQVQSEKLQVQNEEPQAQSEELRTANEALVESEERYRAFFNTSAMGTVEIDLTGRITKVNDRYCQITGYNREELLNMNAEELSHPDDREHNRKLLADYLSGETQTFNVEKRYVLKDDRIIWVQVTASMVRDKDGRPLRSIGLVQDITERKRADEAHKKSREILEKNVKERTAELEVAYSSLLENELRLNEAQKIAHLGYWDWNPLTDELYWSDEISRIFVLDPLEFNGTYNEFLTYVHPDDRDYVDNAFKKALKEGTFDIDYRVISADGGKHIVHAQGEVIFNEKLTPIRVRGTTMMLQSMKKLKKLWIKWKNSA